MDEKNKTSVKNNEALKSALNDPVRRLLLACINGFGPLHFLVLRSHYQVRQDSFFNNLKILKNAKLIENVAKNPELPEYDSTELGRKWLENVSAAEFFDTEVFNKKWPVTHWRNYR